VGPYVGVRVPATAMQTGDADLAMDPQEVDDSLPPILGILEAVDPSFRAVPHQADKARVTAFVNRTNFLTGNPASPAVISVKIIAHENSARRIA
jgi:hypothetical protein